MEANDTQAHRPGPAWAWIGPWVMAGMSLAILLLGGLWLCPQGACRVPAADLATAIAVGHGLPPGTQTFLTGITWLGSLAVLLPLALVTVLMQPQRSRPRRLFVPAALGAATLLAHLTKLAFDRPRPLLENLTALPPDASFPSAHAMQVTAFALALLWSSASRPPPLAWAFAGALIVSVGFSRVALNVHFATDVILGTAAAVCLSCALRGWLVKLESQP